MEDRESAWPDITVSAWAGTKRSLHRYAQILGKIRLDLSPPQPNWMFTPLYLTARGFGTGPLPLGLRSAEVRLDVYASEIRVQTSDGREIRIPLIPARTVAQIFESVRHALETLEIDCTISPIPQEVPDLTPLDDDVAEPAYDPVAVQRWFRAMTATAGVFERWRSHFFGRSGIPLWWGAFDLAVILFNGRRIEPPTDRGYLMRYDLDAELLNCGLYLGDETTPPFFYGYVYPQPANADKISIHPADASWSDVYKEWVLPYDLVRSDTNPSGKLEAFLDSLYEVCVTDAGWNRDALSYEFPKRRTKH